VEQLANILEELIGLLRAHGESHWSSLIADDLYFVRKGDVYGAKRFLGYFGGMGSLNDSGLCQVVGNAEEMHRQSEVNKEFDELKDRAYVAARAVVRGTAC